MNLTDKPLIKYLPGLKRDAYKSGYLWIMILLARKLDFIEGYKELFSGWSSFDSVTGKSIMFLFSNNSGDQIGVNYNMGKMDICTDISVCAENASFPSGLYHITREELKEKDLILEAQTSSVESVKEYFRIRENDIPCLLMFSTMTSIDEKNDSYVFPLKNEKAYSEVKKIVSSVETLLEKYEKVLTPDVLTEVLSKSEKKYLKAKKNIETICCGDNTLFESADAFVKSIEGIDNPNNYLKEEYDHKTIGFINQYKDLLEAYPSIDEVAVKKENDMNRISQFYFEADLVLRNLQLGRELNKTDDSLLFTLSIIDVFKRWVEMRQGYEAIKDSSEKVIQKEFDLLAYPSCSFFNWDLSPETNSGRGPVDFKISRGDDKTVIEIKLTSNPQCVHGLEVQIEEYSKAENTDKKIFLLINNGQNTGRVQDVMEKEIEMQQNGKNPAKVIVIDANPKKSASRMR